MKTGTFLDLDMTSLAGLLRNGWRWWVEEMTALLPLSQKKQARPVIGSIVHLLDDGGAGGTPFYPEREQCAAE